MKPYNYLTLVLSFFLIACNQEEPSTTPAVATGDVELLLSPEITAAEANARVSQNNTDHFAKGSQLALSIFPKDGYENATGEKRTITTCNPYIPIPQYRLIRVTATEDNKDKYNYLPITFEDKEDSKIEKLFLKQNTGPLDVYCYHPFMGYEVETFEKIPFKVGTRLADNYDYMIPTTGKPITINPNEMDPMYHSLTIKIPLRHIMTQLEFRFDISFAGPDLLPHFSITTSADSPIITEGTFSFYDGGLTSKEQTNQFTFIGDYIDVNSYPIPTLPNYRKNAIQGFIFPAIEVPDTSNDEMTIAIKFNADNPVPIQSEPFKFKLKDLTVVDDKGITRHGLITGYKYIVNIKVDNFIKYSGIPYVRKWTKEEIPEIPI